MEWKNLIVDHGDVDPKSLVPNPNNWRVHPQEQREVLEGQMNQVGGWVQSVMVNRRTGNVVDGHLRIKVAIERGEPTVPVDYVDLSEEAERLVLATLDPIAGLAQTDDKIVKGLVESIGAVESEAVSKLLGMISGEKPPSSDWADALRNLGGKDERLETMTFVLTADQAKTVKAGLDAATQEGPFEEGNKSEKGNALARMAERYLG